MPCHTENARSKYRTQYNSINITLQGSRNSHKGRTDNIKNKHPNGMSHNIHFKGCSWLWCFSTPQWQTWQSCWYMLRLTLSLLHPYSSTAVLSLLCDVGSQQWSATLAPSIVAIMGGQGENGAIGGHKLCLNGGGSLPYLSCSWGSIDFLSPSDCR